MKFQTQLDNKNEKIYIMTNIPKFLISKINSFCYQRIVSTVRSLRLYQVSQVTTVELAHATVYRNSFKEFINGLDAQFVIAQYGAGSN